MLAPPSPRLLRPGYIVTIELLRAEEIWIENKRQPKPHPRDIALMKRMRRRRFTQASGRNHHGSKLDLDNPDGELCRITFGYPIARQLLWNQQAEDVARAVILRRKAIAIGRVVRRRTISSNSGPWRCHPRKAPRRARRPGGHRRRVAFAPVWLAQAKLTATWRSKRSRVMARKSSSNSMEAFITWMSIGALHLRRVSHGEHEKLPCFSLSPIEPTG